MESQPCRTRILITPSSCGAAGLVEQLLGGPSVPIASCHVPTAPGEVVQLLLLGEDPWGSFVFAVGCGILGTRSPAVPWEEFRFGRRPLGFSAGPRRLLNLLFTAGKWGGRRAGIPRGGAWMPLSSPSQKSAFSAFAPSLAPWAVGDSRSEAGWSFGSLGIRLGFKENL